MTKPRKPRKPTKRKPACQVSKPDPLALAREFVATVEKFDSVPFMMTSYDAGKLAICRALIEASEHLNRIRLLVPVWMGDVTYDAVKRELDRLGTRWPLPRS